jgi:hypothetical protein
VSSGWGGSGTRLFRRCVGVAGGEESDEGAMVEEGVSGEVGRVAGSKSRSGMGGERKGRRVIRRRIMRRRALKSGSVIEGEQATRKRTL